MKEIWIDGSCLGNPGFGGWAVWCPSDNIKLGGYSSDTTNNRMELSALVDAVESFEGPLRIYTDSEYIIGGATKGWRLKKNTDLWFNYFSFADGREIDFVWTRGHSQDKNNNIVDEMARGFAECSKNRHG